MQGTRVIDTPQLQAWQRTLLDGSRVILFLNPTASAESAIFDLGLIGIAGPRYHAHDLWTGQAWSTPGPLTATVGGHDVRMLQLTPPPPSRSRSST
jgi:hypothetical protein